MTGIDSVLAFFKDWLQTLLTPSGIWQIVVIILSLGIALLAHKRWQKFISSRLGEAERAGFKRFLLRGSGRIILPLVMTLLLLVGSQALSHYNLATSILDILIPLLLSLAIVRLVVYTLRRAYTPSHALRTLEGVISTLIWAAVAMHILGWLPDILKALDDIGITFGQARLSILSVMKLCITVAIFIVAAGWLSRWIEERARRSAVLSAAMQVGIAKFSKVALYTIAVLVALDSVGIDLTTLTVFGGALGVGLGFGLQRIASNFISGFILLFDRSIRPGDVISIGTRFGWVVALHARYIVVRDRDGVETLIPNENLITSEVTNWSFTDKHVRIKIPVQISYGDDPELAMKLLEEASNVNKRILSDPGPQSRLIEFGDNGISLELRIWIDDPQEGIGNVRSDVNLAIWRLFKEAGVSIPFPQRDVHVIKNEE